MKKGVPVSPGVAVARAYCVDQGTSTCPPGQLEAAAVPAEINSFTSACAAAAQELDATIAREYFAETLGWN